MARDKNDTELQIGDEVCIRARVEEVYQIGDDESQTLIRVTWLTTETVPLIDYLKPQAVEKCQD